MKKNAKRFISLLLSVLMLMSVMTAGVSALDITGELTPVEVEPTPEAEENHPYLFEVFIDFWIEVYEFFKYIFYDVFRGDVVA